MLFSEFSFGGACYPGLTATKFIQYTAPTKLAVVQGGTELMSIDLQDFSIPVQLSQKTSFVLPAHSQAYLPVDYTTFTYCGMTASGSAKFATFFPCFPTGTTSSEMYIEWAYLSDLNYQAFIPPVDLVNAGYNVRNVTGFSTILGSEVGFTATETYLITTDGGLKIWSPADGTVLFNRYNSSLNTNSLNCVTHDGLGNVWIGSQNAGAFLMVYGSGTYSFTNFSLSNSDISSSQVNDIMINGDKVAMATGFGISVFDTVAETWSNYSTQNVNQIKSNFFSKIFIDNDYIVGASDSGVYVYTIATSTWSRYGGARANATSIAGWTGANNVTSLEVVNGEVFLGTDATILTFTIGATAVTEIPNTALRSTVPQLYVFGASGSTTSFINTGGLTFSISDDAILTNSITDMKVAGVTVGFTASYTPGTFPNTTAYVTLASSGATGASLSFSYQKQTYHTVSGINYYSGVSGADKMVISYFEGGISRYDVLSSTWDFNYNGSTGSTGTATPELNYGVHFLTPDYFFGNAYGYSSFDIDALNTTALPDANENGDILFSYPGNNTGDWGLSQSVFFAFSKPVDPASFETHFSWGTAPSYTGLTWSTYSYQGGELIEATLPHPVLASQDVKFASAQGVNFRITAGLTSTDGTYFRQTVSSTFYTHSVVPLTGWKTLGAQLTVSGAEQNSVPSLVFRNPQDFPVEVLVLAAI
jgi:hypothetical protein